jgi:hypothetical protein
LESVFMPYQLRINWIPTSVYSIRVRQLRIDAVQDFCAQCIPIGSLCSVSSTRSTPPVLMLAVRAFRAVRAVRAGGVGGDCEALRCDTHHPEAFDGEGLR